MENQYNTPILFLIFNRPDTTFSVFEEIKKAKPKFLYIAADGPRAHVDNEDARCKETLEIIQQIDWPCELKTLIRKQNLGCKRAVSSAISWFFEHVEEGVILEDDCLPHPSFFPYCEQLLEKYRDDSRVYTIGGNNFQNGVSRGSGSYYFSYYPHIWGWATWKRAWNKYDVSIGDFEPQIMREKLRTVFNSKAEIEYWIKVLSKTKAGNINTWDYQLGYCIWKNGGLSITPNNNIVTNLGLQNNSTHYFLNDSFKTFKNPEAIKFPLIHPPVEVMKEADLFTYNNLFRHSIQRSIRLMKENNFSSLFNYFLKRVFKTSKRGTSFAKSDAGKKVIFE
jgi:hypothetical protein